jgi:enamine deaminase RidA (YjgF/YER057c/UK114 family)
VWPRRVWLDLPITDCVSARQSEKEKWAMKIEVVKSGAPRPLANYSEAMVAGPWIFAAGQLASDFKTGVPAEARKHPNFPFYGSDIKLQTRFVLENLKKTFEATGSSLDNVFKAQVFLTDLNDFFAFDEVWKEYFKVPPARTTVGTTGLLVKDTLVEIDLIGFVPGKGVDKQVIKSTAPRPLAHYNEGFKIGDFVYAAGQIASDYKTGVPADAMRSPNFPFYNSDIKLQTRYILENLKKTFEAAGSSLDNVFKAQVFLTDLNNFNGYAEIAALKAGAPASGASGGPNGPGGGNVVRLPTAAPPASAAPAAPPPPPAKPFVNGLSDIPQSVRDTRPLNEAWRNFVRIDWQG